MVFRLINHLSLLNRFLVPLLFQLFIMNRKHIICMFVVSSHILHLLRLLCSKLLQYIFIFLLSLRVFIKHGRLPLSQLELVDEVLYR